jgi:hypothetical protein
MAKMKKAQMGESVGDKLAAKTAERKTKGASLREGQVKRIVRATNDNPERGLKVRKRIIKRANAKAEAEPMMKNGGMKKAENGAKKTAFGMLSVKKGIDNNPNPTFADKIAGAKKKAMSGIEMMKLGGKAAKQAAIAIAMKKAGKAPKKMMKSGGTLSAPKKDGLSMQLGTYKNVIGKNYTGKNVVNKGAKAKYGKSIMKSGGKCKSGC